MAGRGSRYAAKRRAREERGPAEKQEQRGQQPSANRRKPGRHQPDPSDTEHSEIRYIQPYQATKTYLCPGCNQDIPPGAGHLVAVPPDAPDLRRHWHRSCWNNRHTRR